MKKYLAGIIFTIALLVAPFFAGAEIAAPLKIGNSGPQVAELQTILKSLGYFKGSVTGYFGQKTRKSLIKFQKAHSISPAKGSVDSLTAIAMNSSDETATSSSSNTLPSIIDMPIVTLSANPNPVAYNAGTMLTWNSVNTTSCSVPFPGASAAPAGSFVTPAMATTTTYVVTCKGVNGTGKASVSVEVALAMSTKFTSGTRAQVSSGPINVRSTVNGTIVGKQETGALGTVLSGGTWSGGFYWWNINFDSGLDGWVVENYLVPSANGVCGTANNVAVLSAPSTNLCAVGTPSSVVGSGPWTWACAGQNGGTAASCSAPKAFPPVASGNYTFSFVTPDSLTRSYAVHIPTNYDPLKSYPVLYVSHGAGGTPTSTQISTSFSRYADQRGFIVVYGQGTAWSTPPVSVWNAGTCCGQVTDARNNIDDVGYVRTLIGQVKTKYNVNSARVYASGMSNGSMLTHRLACEASDIFAGAAGVSGTISKSPCVPAKKIPVLMMHGTVDDSVPYYGGRGNGNTYATFISVEQELADWGGRNGCTGAITTTVIPPLDTTDGHTIDKLTFPSCVQSAVLYRINGGTHEWPGGNPFGDPDNIPSKAINASETILSFFGL
jgi:polyhydroxybutyrate depolymerase